MSLTPKIISIPQVNSVGSGFNDVHISGSNLVLQTDNNGILMGYSIVNSASYALTASYASSSGTTMETGSSYEITSSWAINSKTASYVDANNVVGLKLNSISTGSVTASVNVNSDSFKVVDGLSTFLYISSSGNIGIGTDNPVNKLDVVGNINALGISVSTGTFDTLNVTGLLNATQISGSQVYITSSQLFVTDNILTLNANSPHLRYAGIEMYDSGSTSNLASLLWDGTNNYFFLSSSDAGFSRKMVTGPDNEGNLTSGYIPLITSSNGLKDSIISQIGNVVNINGNISASNITASLFYGTSSYAKSSSYSFISRELYNESASINDNGEVSFAGGIFTIDAVGNTGILGDNSTTLDIGSGRVVAGVGQFFSIEDSTTLPAIDVNSRILAGSWSLDNILNGTASYTIQALSASYVPNLYPQVYQISCSWASQSLSASYVDANNVVGLNLSRIATGSVTASVNVGSSLFNITNNETSSLYISSSGNIGINTSTPSAKLDVRGNAYIGGNNQLSDIIPPSSIIMGGNSFSGSTINTSGSNLILGGGIGRNYFTILSGSLLSGSTITVTVNGSSSVLIPSSSFNISSSNYVTAVSMSAALNTISGITSRISGSAAMPTSASYVFVIPNVGTYQLGLAKSVGNTTMSIVTGSYGNINHNTTLTWERGLGNISHIAGPTDNALNIIASPPLQSLASVDGNNIIISASNAISGTSTTSAGIGGSVNIKAGSGASTGVIYSASGGGVNISAGQGGANGSTTTGPGGSININGGLASYNGGNGGNVNINGGSTTISSGTAGSVNITSGGSTAIGLSTGNITIAIANSSGNGGSVPGTLSLLGGYLTGVGNPQNAGNIIITTYGPGMQNVNGTPANGGNIITTLGRGGNTSYEGTSGGGLAGTYSIIGGVGGSPLTGSIQTGGVGSNFIFSLGNGGNVSSSIGSITSSAGPGGTFMINGGSGGNVVGLTSTNGYYRAGTGSNITIASGNGGNVISGSGFRYGGNSGNIVFTIGTPGSGSTASGSYGTFQFLSGSVGIGTSSPQNKLDVVGNISCSVITASLLYGTSSLSVSSSINNTSNNQSYYPLFVSEISGSQLLYTDSTKNLIYNPSTATLTVPTITGILGTSLTIQGPTPTIAYSQANDIIIQGGNSGQGLKAGNIFIRSGLGSFVSTIAFQHPYSNNYITDICITGSDSSTTLNVGIGTDNPINKLDVVGNISCSVITASLLTGTASYATNAITASCVYGPTNASTMIVALPPIQQTSSVNGNSVYISASNATVGSISGNATGGAIVLQAGIGASAIGQATNGGAINIYAGNQGASGGAGGSVNIRGGASTVGSGTGGSVSIVAPGGVGGGGSITLQVESSAGRGTSGNISLLGGAGTAPNNPGIPSNIILTTIAPADQGISPGSGSNGGNIILTLGGGGSSTYATASGGIGGLFSITGGIGGNAAGAISSSGGIGSSISITSGRGGNASAGTSRIGGNSGNIVFTIGMPGSGSTASGSYGNFQFLSGSVGIGTTTPINKLDVVGNISCSVITASLLSGTASYANNAITASYSLSSSYGLSASYSLNSSTASALTTANSYQISSLIVNTNISSAIITASEVSIRGTVGSGNSVTSIHNGTGGGGGSTLSLTNTAGNVDALLKCVNSGIGLAATFTGGNVGIGTTTASNMLDVAGNISCSVITASLFNGTASYANNAISHSIFNTTNNQSYYPIFVSEISGSQLLLTDDNKNLTYNPSTNTLTLPTVVGNLTGTSSWASNSLTASYIGTGTNNYVPLWNNNTLTATSSIYQSGNSLIIQGISSVLNMPTSSVAILVSQSLSQSVVGGSQIYGVSLNQRFTNTTSSQTQTAFRVLPTFTGNWSGSNTQNIIMDVGATSVGTQFSVNDITSGSIYMVNDVSGLPIIEALSDWTVNMYNYPYTIFKKSGNNIILGTALTSSTTTIQSDVVMNKGIGFSNSTTQVSGSTNGAVTASLYNLVFSTVSSSVYMSAIVTGYNTSSRDVISGDVKATIRYRNNTASIVGYNQKFINSDNAVVDFNIVAGSNSASLQAYGSASCYYNWGSTVSYQII